MGTVFSALQISRAQYPEVLHHRIVPRNQLFGEFTSFVSSGLIAQMPIDIHHTHPLNVLAGAWTMSDATDVITVQTPLVVRFPATYCTGMDRQYRECEVDVRALRLRLMHRARRTGGPHVQ